MNFSAFRMAGLFVLWVFNVGNFEQPILEKLVIAISCPPLLFHVHQYNEDFTMERRFAI